MGLIDNAWIIFAHIERAEAYQIEHFRDFNNAAPDICFGFEGAPGHQVNSKRGFGRNPGGAYGGAFGGVGSFTAEVGGLWDALLGEGRRWFNYANSDYHKHWTAGGDDFYPGEYQKTYVTCRGQRRRRGILTERDRRRPAFRKRLLCPRRPDQCLGVRGLRTNG